MTARISQHLMFDCDSAALATVIFFFGSASRRVPKQPKLFGGERSRFHSKFNTPVPCVVRKKEKILVKTDV
jgi:hypothetical protein